MNIAHCIHGLGMGGAQKVIAAIIRGQQDPSFRHFVYSSNDGMLREEFEATGAVVRVIERRLPKLDPLWVLGLARWMRRDRIDLVHTHLFGDSLHGFLAARAAGSPPVVMTLHSMLDMFTPIQRKGYHWFLPGCARVIACSQSSADTFRGFVDLPHPIVTIPNGIEAAPAQEMDEASRAQVRRDLGLDPDAVVVATVGRLSYEKGYDLLLEAFAQLPEESARRAHLILFGDGPERGALEEQRSRLGLDDRVVFGGFRNDVVQLLPAIDVIAFSSRVEGLPITLLEAMATARCVVGTAIPGIVEAAREDQEALIVPIGDVEGLAGALAQVIDQPELRQRLGRAGQERFLSRFTAQIMVKSYEDVYRQVAGKK